MKKRLIYLLACFAFATLSFTNASASNAISTQEMRVGMAEKVQASTEKAIKNNPKAAKRFHRIAKRLERKIAKSTIDIDFEDPVDKWLWFGIFGLGIAIVLSFFTPFGLAGLIAFAAVICLVVWVVKQGA